MIETFLPPLEHAVALCDNFFQHLSWMTSIVSRDYVVGTLIPRVYKHALGRYGSHDLSLVLIIFGLGASVNLEDVAYSLG